MVEQVAEQVLRRLEKALRAAASRQSGAGERIHLGELSNECNPNGFNCGDYYCKAGGFECVGPFGCGTFTERR
jgi:hypothetical protein